MDKFGDSYIEVNCTYVTNIAFKAIDRIKYYNQLHKKRYLRERFVYYNRKSWRFRLMWFDRCKKFTFEEIKNKIEVTPIFKDELKRIKTLKNQAFLNHEGKMLLSTSDYDLLSSYSSEEKRLIR